MPCRRMMQHSPAMSFSSGSTSPVPPAQPPKTALHIDRRRLLQIGAGATVVLALAGTGAALWSPGWRRGRLSASGRELFAAVAQAVLAANLPIPPAAREQAISGLLDRLDATLAGLPAATRDQLSQLLGLMQIGPARRWLCGLDRPWGQASDREVERALARLRAADDALRQQVYHALRDLVSASYFADPATWPQLGYPGPTAL